CHHHGDGCQVDPARAGEPGAQVLRYGGGAQVAAAAALLPREGGGFAHAVRPVGLARLVGLGRLARLAAVLWDLWVHWVLACAHAAARRSTLRNPEGKASSEPMVSTVITPRRRIWVSAPSSARTTTPLTP